MSRTEVTMVYGLPMHLLSLAFSRAAAGGAPNSLTNVQVADVYRQYGHLMHRRCRSILRCGALADDALQNALIKVMRYGKRLLEADSKLRWLYRVCDRACFDLLDKRKRRAEVPEIPTDAVIEHPAAQIEARDAVTRILGTLGETDRKIAVLHFVEGMSQGDVSSELNLSRQTINKRLQKIRHQVQQPGGSDE